MNLDKWSLQALHAMMRKLTIMLAMGARGRAHREAAGQVEHRDRSREKMHARRLLCAELRAALRLCVKIQRRTRSRS